MKVDRRGRPRCGLSADYGLVLTGRQRRGDTVSPQYLEIEGISMMQIKHSIFILFYFLTQCLEILFLCSRRPPYYRRLHKLFVELFFIYFRFSCLLVFVPSECLSQMRLHLCFVKHWHLTRGAEGSMNIKAASQRGAADGQIRLEFHQSAAKWDSERERGDDFSLYCAFRSCPAH